MSRTIMVAAILILWLGPAVAQECAQEVLGSLFEELESIDAAGEKRLTQALDELSKQEGWSERERSDYTLSIADNPDVDATEARRTDVLAQIFALAHRGNVDCAEIGELHAEALELVRAQWDAAVKQVDQRIWH
jgi:hypothetical protein